MSQRYQREIEEILRQAGRHGKGSGPYKPKPGFLRLVWLHVTQSLGGKVLSLTPGRLMLIAFVLLLAALVLNSAAPSFGITGLVAWSGLILLIVGYAMFFIRPKPIKPIEKRWRGQKIELNGESWWERLRRKKK